MLEILVGKWEQGFKTANLTPVLNKILPPRNVLRKRCFYNDPEDKKTIFYGYYLKLKLKVLKFYIYQ